MKRKENKRKVVRHHYHGGYPTIDPLNGKKLLPGAYLGPAHFYCNFFNKYKDKLTILFHNFSKFDSRFVITGCYKAGITDIEVLAKSSQNFLQLTVGKKLRFIDSLNLMPFALGVLIENIKKDLSPFKATKQMLPDLTDEQYMLLISKQALPYEFLNLENIKEKRDALPPIEAFYSKLKNANISADMYQAANDIYKIFNCKTLEDYLRIYNILDVGTTIDALEEHRRLSFKHLKLDRLAFVTLPSAAFRSAMASSKQKLEYVKNIDAHILITKAIRAGICTNPQRYTERNQPGELNYNPEKPLKAIAFLDVSSMYLWAQTKKLYHGGLRKLSEEEVMAFKIMETDTEGEKGYLLRVRAKYNNSLHNLHNDLPFLPEKICLDKYLASDLQKKMCKENPQLTSYFGKEAYLLTLYDKEDYCDFLPSIKTAAKYGLEIEPLEIWEFDQSDYVEPWMREKNEGKRTAPTKSEAQTLKLIANGTFGSFLRNTRRYRNFNFVFDHVSAEREIKSPNFKTFTILNKGMVLIEKKRNKILNSHTIVGGHILSRARSRFYELYYAMKKKCPNNEGPGSLRLNYTDTDSFCMTFEGTQKEFYEMLEQVELDDEKIMDWSWIDDNSEYAYIKKGILINLGKLVR